MKTNLANIYGSPGSRVRFTGLLKLFFPFILIIFLLGLLIGNITGKLMPTQMYAFVILILVIFGWLMYDVAAKSFGAFLKGARGEEIVARELSMLSNEWSIFHGIPTNGVMGTLGGTDFDHIIVGPAGIIIIETKNWTGKISIEAGQINLNGVSPSRSPLAQIRKEANQLCQILYKNVEPTTPLHMVIAFASNSLESEMTQIDDIFVCNARKIREFIMGLPRYENVSKQKQQLLIEHLAKLSE
jgi:hypothetical protein